METHSYGLMACDKQDVVVHRLVSLTEMLLCLDKQGKMNSLNIPEF